MEHASPIYGFGRFRLDTARRTLLRDSVPVALSSRGFDLLLLLIEQRRRVVGKEEILDQVWHGLAVEENNLAVQISALRRALGDRDGPDRIVQTVQGRGYRFVAALDEAPEPRAPAIADIPPDAPLPPVPVILQPIPRRRAALVFAGLGCLLAAVGVAHVFRLDHAIFGPPAPPRLSIAVLPFRNLSTDAEQGYLADAVSDDLTTDLSHIPGSVVIARETADSFKGHFLPIDQIGRALHVRYVLEGSLRPVGDTLSINAQLIDAATDTHLWAARFDVPREKLGEAQHSIDERIASALNVSLVDIEGERSLRDRPQNPDALDLFFRARSIFNHDDSLAGDNQAQDLLQRAIAAAPDFADAQALLGWLLLTKMRDHNDPAEAADDAEARAVIARALILAPKNPRGLAARGLLLTMDGHCDEARASYQSALAADPNNLQARGGLALCAWNEGRPEAVIQPVRESLQLDPENPANKLRFQMLGMASLMLGHADEAADWLSRAAARDAAPVPGNDSMSQPEWTALFVIAADALSGHPRAAAARYADYEKSWPHRSVWRVRGYFTQAQLAMPGFPAVADAWEKAGMPRFADMREAAGIPPDAVQADGGDFAPTPAALPGGRVIDTAALAAWVHSGSPPEIIDVGRGVAVPPGALWWADGAPSATLAPVVSRAGGDATPPARPIVVMSDGAYGLASYLLARRLVSEGREVFWYRGGEEAWAAAGLPAERRHTP